MKINFVCFKFTKIIYFIICIVLIIITSFAILVKNSTTKIENIQTTSYLDNECKKIKRAVKKITVQNNSTKQAKKKTKTTRIMPQKLKGFEIIGKIKIPKLKLEKYILKETNTKSLKASVTKLYGPEINKIGNFCIAGHNYNKVFGGIKNLKQNDKIILVDVFGNQTIYKVYDVYQTSPKDVSCLNQDTNGETELTLITCTKGAIKRTIVKANGDGGFWQPSTTRQQCWIR